jgi:HlyD family secretion protein
MIDAHDSESTESREQLSSRRSSEPAVSLELPAAAAAKLQPISPNKSSFLKRSWIIVLALLGAAGIATFSWQGISKFVGKGAAQDGAAPAAMTVSTTVAKMQQVDDAVSVTGSVSAWDPLTVGAESGGMRITSVNVEEGDTVKKGQILATLNSSVLRAQLVQAKAKLVSAEASVKKSIQPNRPEAINGLKDMLAQNAAEIQQEEALKREAGITWETASRNAKRWAYMAKAGAVSAADAEAKKATADIAHEEMTSATAKLLALRSISKQTTEKLNEAQSGGRLEDVEISQATVAETRGQIEQLTHQIEQTFIKAPDDGMVAKRDAHLGDITTVGAPLFSIIRMNKLELRAQVSDIDLAKFRTGQLVKVSVNEDDDGKIAGRVSLVSPQVDQATRLGIVRISLPSNAGLKPGMFVRGQVDMGHRKALTVPSTAVITRNGESFVFTLSGNRAVAAPVKVGVTTDKFAEIKEGLQNGEVIVDAGARFLSDRDIVRVEK